MRYLITPAQTGAEAWGMSAAMWALGQSDTSETAHAVSVVRHPDTGAFALDLHSPPVFI
jgi:hypothetical protein